MILDWTGKSMKLRENHMYKDVKILHCWCGIAPTKDGGLMCVFMAAAQNGIAENVEQALTILKQNLKRQQKATLKDIFYSALIDWDDTLLIRMSYSIVVLWEEALYC